MPTRYYTKEEIEKVKEGYKNNKTPTELSKEMNRSAHSIRNKAYKMGITNNTKFTKKEIKKIKLTYENANFKDELNLDHLAEELNRPKTNICRKARQLGLTNGTKKYSPNWKERKELSSKDEIYKHFWWLKLNYIEMDKPVEKIAEKVCVGNDCINKWIRFYGLREEKINKLGYSTKTNDSGLYTGVNKKKFHCANCGKEIKRYSCKVKGKNIFCSYHCKGVYSVKHNKGSIYSDAKGGKREDLNGQYFRSAWEANYARYLNFVGEKWEYEPKEFEFEEIKRGTRFYTPDFYLPNKDQYVEIKGWFRRKDKTKLKRFKKYYPEEFKKLILVIDRKFKGKQAIIANEIGINNIESYSEIENKVGDLIENWE
ncbi:MAG: hypothetical protein K9K32_06760 [Halanaerobiales bacterium]|nr:hypothetical protein [Halanaerobiales bacterium]